MIHNATVVNTRRKHRRRNLEIKKLKAVVHYSKFMKGIYRADH
jgi:hypothetical protein